MFTTVFTILLAIVIAVCIWGLFIIIPQIKVEGWFLSLCVILLDMCVIGILVMGICLLQDWGNQQDIREWMAYLGLAGIGVGLTAAIKNWFFS